MAPKKRTGQLTAFDAPPVLSTKRKRATISHAEVEADAMSDDENSQLPGGTTRTDTNKYDAFGASREVRCL